MASYRDHFRLLFAFAQTRLGRSPTQLTLRDLDAPFIGAFLEDYLETLRSASVRTRNLRLTAIRSFFRYASFEEPAHSAQIQRVLAIPSKRCDKRQLQFLTRPEIEAILACPIAAHGWDGVITLCCCWPRKQACGSRRSSISTGTRSCVLRSLRPLPTQTTDFLNS
ncbi:hypothetical protein NKH06_17085 [Mesorhizobium sp. M1342]